MPLSRQPMLWAASMYAAGIAPGFYVWRPPLWWLVAALVFSTSGAYFLRRRTRAALALGLSALFVTGALTMQVRVPEKQGSAGVLAFADGRDVIVTAHVTKEGNLRKEGPGDTQQRLDLETEQIGTSSDTGDQAFAIHSGLRASFYGHGVKSEDGTNESERSVSAPTHLFRYGERLRFPAKLYPPHNFRNPGAFDYTGYLAENGI